MKCKLEERPAGRQTQVATSCGKGGQLCIAVCCLKQGEGVGGSYHSQVVTQAPLNSDLPEGQTQEGTASYTVVQEEPEGQLMPSHGSGDVGNAVRERERGEKEERGRGRGRGRGRETEG